MSKKHFIALADMIRMANRNTEPEGLGYWDSAHIQQLASFCQGINPNFDRARWLAYIAGECGPNGGTVKKQAVA